MKITTKLIYIICYVFLLISCNRNNKYKLVDEFEKAEIKEALDYFIEDFSKKSNDNFILENFICPRLKDSAFWVSINQITNEENIRHMIHQYDILKAKKLETFVSAKFQDRIINENYKYPDTINYVEISPPLFSTEKNYFVIFAFVAFHKRVNANWDALFYIFKKSESKWEHIACIRPDTKFIITK